MLQHTEKKRAAIYVRVSTVGQAEEGYSIDEQERLLRQLCEIEGYDIVDVYADRGISAKNISGRPEFMRLLDDVKAKEIDILLAWKLTRISRKLKDVLDIVELLKQYNVAVRFLSEKVDTSTPGGMLQLQMMAMIAEYEREAISSNVALGMRAKAAQGGFLGGKVLGYDSVKTIDVNQRTTSRLVINEREAELVREIFRLYNNGKGYKAIVTELNNSGKDYKTKKGGALSVGTVQGILKNPIYAGYIQFDKFKDYSRNRKRNINPNMILTKGIHEQIISQETWEKTKRLMQVNGGIRENKHNDFTPLCGILKCPVCGAGMVLSRAPGKNGKRIAYYSCGNWKNKGTSICHSNSIRVEKANEVVFQRLSQFISNDRMIRGILSKLNQEHSSRIAPAQKQLKIIDKEIERFKQKKIQLFDSYEDRTISKDEFIERKSYISQCLEQYEQERIKHLEVIKCGNTQEISYENVKYILNQIQQVFQSDISNQEVKVLLKLMIDKITINKLRDIDSITIQLNKELLDYIIVEMLLIRRHLLFYL